MAMTIESAIGLVRGLLRQHPKGVLVRDAWELLESHLTQPAQAVDVVGDLRALAAQWRERESRDSKASGEYYSGRSHGYEACADAIEDLLTRALAGEKAEGWRDGKARAMALHAAVGAIYFADGSDCLSALWEVVRELGPDLVDELAANPSAVWHRTMAETDRFTLPTPPTDGEE